MLPQVLLKNRFDEFVRFLTSTHRVAAPVAKGPQFVFDLLHDSQDVDRVRMDYDITILPPKKYLLATHERLLEFAGRDPASANAPIQALPTVLLGVHPYDLHAIATADAFFSLDPADPYYQARRAATKLIGVNVQAPANDHQFQADMGTLEPPQGGFELFMTDLGDRYFVEVGSAEGAAIMKTSGLFAPAGPAEHKAKQNYDRIKAGNFVKKLPYDTRYLPEMLNASYDSLLWEAIARRCFSCPTCFCFDVQDKLNIDAVSGNRGRVWDSCQLKVFAEVAGGENFREHRASRTRHRMFRKGKYIFDRTGRTGCVGCGRCIYHCVANISILEAFLQIAGEAAEIVSAEPKR
jgi:sulfhydrogenase subunit beta (sulfur reductase)